MPCPDFITSQSGRAGIGVIQPQSGLDYPLVAPSADIDNLIADFYLAYDDPSNYNRTSPVIRHPLRIQYLAGVGCIENSPITGFPTLTHGADIIVIDAANTVVFDTFSGAVDFEVADWSRDYKIYTWKKAQSICRLVVYRTWAPDNLARKNYPLYLQPTNAVLDERTIYRMPKRLLSLRVKNSSIVSGPYSGKITLRNGYNTTITAAEQTEQNFRAATDVVIGAEAGTGLGKYIDCLDAETTKPITRINGVAGVNGDFLLAAADCIWARRPTVHTGTNITAPAAELKFGADCTPCCSCGDYADTAKYLNETVEQYKLIGVRAENVRAQFENNILRWNDQRACSVQRPLRLILVPQRCPYMDVVMLLCNSCDTCISASRLQVAITAPTGVTAELECGYTAMFAPNINGQATTVTRSSDGRTYSAFFPQLPPGESAYLKFRLKFTETNPATKATHKPFGPYPIACVLTGVMLNTGGPLLNNCANPVDGVPATAETTQTLYCSSTGRTELPC